MALGPGVAVVLVDIEEVEDVKLDEVVVEIIVEFELAPAW